MSIWNKKWELLDVCQACNLSEWDCICGSVDTFFNDIRDLSHAEQQGGGRVDLECSVCECCPCECDEY